MTDLWSQALRAIRTNALPGLVLWLIAAAVVALYYGVPAAQPVFSAVAQAKTDGGFVFSIVATAVFAGLIPYLVNRGPVSTLVFLVFFWGYRGFEVDLLYRFQAWMFGSEPTVTTIVAKVAFDLFVYNVIWAAGLQLAGYAWKDGGYRWSALRGFWGRTFWTQRLPTALLSTWTVWLPVVALIYSLPGPLQIPLFNLAACFWSLVVASLTRKPAPLGKTTDG